ncbi:MAG: hypothetical protein RJA98_2365 [Pseudomonadota bacterium]|jgi:hypothetical protein
MFASIKRWLSPPRPEAQWSAPADWAQRTGHRFKQTHEHDGFVIEGEGTSGFVWRLEWGPPQRAYVSGPELRFRSPLKLPHDLQMLVISRALMDRLERETFERFTESTQTQIDVATPEEMRWLAMFPKARLAEFKVLRAAYGAMSAHPKWADQWLAGPLAGVLAEFSGQYLSQPRPFVLMTTRGNAYLRMQLDAPDLASLQAALSVFECACSQARRVAMELAAGEGWPSTNSAAFAGRPADDPTQF